MGDVSDGYEDPGAAMMKNLASMAGQVTAGLAEATRIPVYEYQMVSWEQVNPLAREGWKLRAADITLRQFVMARKLGPADEAERLLR